MIKAYRAISKRAFDAGIYAGSLRYLAAMPCTVKEMIADGYAASTPTEGLRVLRDNGWCINLRPDPHSKLEVWHRTVKADELFAPIKTRPARAECIGARSARYAITDQGGD